MEELEDVGSSVSFLYKAMLERDPSKRRVKPVQDHMLQLDFAGLEDSSDDSDFEVPTGKDTGDSDPDSDIIEDDGDEDEDDEDENESDDDDDDEDDKSDGDECQADCGTSKSNGKDTKGAIQAPLSVAAAEEVMRTTSGPPRKIKVVICAVCMGDRSGEDDEIVECDGCGITVHEGCYGVVDSQSIASTESSASTEPWFCDACKAGVKPSCILCPNTSGIFKETDTGQWAHLVCALYIPGVTFGDVDKLSSITVFELQQSKWGAKACSLCEDIRFSRTGVCLGCDAGMCRAHFHVTCAQREGLLFEANPEEEIADPFYAYCKQHADKMSARIKRRNFMAMQSNMRQHAEREINEEGEKRRVLRKLQKHKQKYQFALKDRPPGWVGTEKHPRMLTTSASAMKNLIHKAELMGFDTDAAQTSLVDVRRMWHIPPALSVEFISYFLDRNKRIEKMKNNLKELVNAKVKLASEEKTLRVKYDKLLEEANKLKSVNDDRRGAAEKIWKVIQDVSEKPVALPEVLIPKKVVKSASKRNLPRSPMVSSVIHSCNICAQTTDQHLLAKCDTCKLYYHIGCLDPPLTRMPKKSKLYGWQCSECDKSSSDEEEHAKKINTNAPMRLRQTIKEPAKFTPPCLYEKNKKGERPRSRPRKDELKSVLNLPESENVAELGFEEMVSESITPSPVKSTPEKYPVSSGSETTPTGGSAKKKRGRPPKNRDIPTTPAKSVASDDSGLTPKKRRGRPPKKREDEFITPMLDSFQPLSHDMETAEDDDIDAATNQEIDMDMDMPILERVSPILIPISEPIPTSGPIPSSEPIPTSDPIPARSANRPKRVGRKTMDLRTLCCVCSLCGDNNNLVRCDSCKLCFHFGCLDPPCRKSPKQRGYDWHCHICDSSESDDSVEEEFEKKPESIETVDTLANTNSSLKSSQGKDDSDDVIVIDLDSLPDSTDSAIEAKLDEVALKQKQEKKPLKKEVIDKVKIPGPQEHVLGKRVPKETPKAAQARIEAMYRQQTIAKKHNKFFLDELDNQSCLEHNDIPHEEMDASTKPIKMPEHSEGSGKNCEVDSGRASEDLGGPPCLERMDSVDSSNNSSARSCSPHEFNSNTEPDPVPPQKKLKLSDKAERESSLVVSPTESETGIRIERKFISNSEESGTENSVMSPPPVDKSASDLNTALPLKRKYLKRPLSGTAPEGEGHTDGHHSLASLDDREKKPKKSAVSSAFVMGQMKFSAPSKEDRKLMKQNKEPKENTKSDGIPKIVPPLPIKDPNFSVNCKPSPSVRKPEEKSLTDLPPSKPPEEVTQKDGPPNLSPQAIVLKGKHPSQDFHDLCPPQTEENSKTDKDRPDFDNISSLSDSSVFDPKRKPYAKIDSLSDNSPEPVGNRVSRHPHTVSPSHVSTASSRKRDSSPAYKLDMSPQAIAKSDTSSTTSSVTSPSLKRSDSEGKGAAHKKTSNKRGRPSTSFEDIDAFVEKFDLPSFKAKKLSKHHKRSESGEDDVQQGRLDSSGHHVTNFKKKHSKKRRESSTFVDIESLVGQFCSMLDLPRDKPESVRQASKTNSKKHSKYSNVHPNNPFASNKVLSTYTVSRKTEKIAIPKMNSKSNFVKSGAMDKNNLCSGKSSLKSDIVPRESTFSRASTKSQKTSSLEPVKPGPTTNHGSDKKDASSKPIPSTSKSSTSAKTHSSTSKSSGGKSSSSQSKSSKSSIKPSKPSGSSRSHSSSKTSNSTKDSKGGSGSTVSKSSMKTNSSHKSSSSSIVKEGSTSSVTNCKDKGSSKDYSRYEHSSSKTRDKEIPVPEKHIDHSVHKESVIEKDVDDTREKESDDTSAAAKSAKEVTYEEFMRTYQPGTFKTSPLEYPLKKRGRKQAAAAKTDVPKTDAPKPNAPDSLSSPESGKNHESVDSKSHEASKNISPPCNTANMSLKKRFKISFLKGSKEGDDISKPEATVTPDITNGNAKKQTA